MAERKKSSTGSKVETGVGAGLFAAGFGAKRQGFASVHRKTDKIDADVKRAKNYLNQGGVDPKKRMGLDTRQKKEALRTINSAKARRAAALPKAMNKGEFFVPIAAVGAGMAYHGGRKQFQKSFKRKDADAAAAGALGGTAAYYTAGYTGKYKAVEAGRKKLDAGQKKKLADHATKHRPSTGLEGDPRWKNYWRNYPKDLPGGKTARVLGRTHGGKTGTALLAASVGTGATGAVVARRKIDKRAPGIPKKGTLKLLKNEAKVYGTALKEGTPEYARALADNAKHGFSTKKGKVAVAATIGGGGVLAHNKIKKSRVMSDAEIKRRKKLQGKISQTTSTLGLAGVGIGGTALLAAKKPNALKRVPGLKKANPDKLKDAGLYTSLASGGIGGVGGYNFAAYTNAESRKRTMVQPKKTIKKSAGVSAFGVDHSTD